MLSYLKNSIFDFWSKYIILKKKIPGASFKAAVKVYTLFFKTFVSLRKTVDVTEILAIFFTNGRA